MFTDHKISAFQQRVSDLPDTPSLSASELKARFDACPEELRQALNGVCDDGKALEDRMDAYQAQTFTGEVERDMLAPDVQEELSAKAEQEALDAEAAARAAGDAALNSRLSSVETVLPLKCRVAVGSYSGTGNTSTNTSQQINIGFTPKAVFAVGGDGTYFHYQFRATALAVTDTPAMVEGGIALQIIENGFLACNYSRSGSTTTANMNSTGNTYHYIAIG